MNRSRYVRRLAIVALLTVGVAACGSSSSKGSGPTTVASGSPGGNSTTTAAVSKGGGNSGTTVSTAATMKLMTPLCNILNSSDVVRIVGGDVGSCQNFANEDTAGRALWGSIGPGKNSLQLTAFTGADLAQKKLGWNLTFPKVAGAGKGAWSRGPLRLGTINNEVLYVDYGDFGLEFAVSSPTADNNTAVQLANAIK